MIKLIDLITASYSNIAIMKADTYVDYMIINPNKINLQYLSTELLESCVKKIEAMSKDYIRVWLEEENKND